MTSDIQTKLYLSQPSGFKFKYPLNRSTKLELLQTELDMSDEDFEHWQPDFVRLPMYDHKKLKAAISDSPFVYVSETHSCRELAASKAAYCLRFWSLLSTVYRKAMLVVSGDTQIPQPFHDVVTEHILLPQGVGSSNTDIWCNLDASEFAVAMNPGFYRTPWVSLLTYFSKYGEYMYDLAYSRYGNKDSYDLDETINIILDSWYGQVGFYSAFALWCFAEGDTDLLFHADTWSSGVYETCEQWTSSVARDRLLDFISEYNLDLERVSKQFIANYYEYLILEDYAIPDWYENGWENDHNIAESDEWNEYMGYDDEDDEDYDGDENYDFEEEW